MEFSVQSLIDRARELDPRLADDIRLFAQSREYGLVFEHNRPESIRLYGKPIAVGDHVNILPDRGNKETAGNAQEWTVTGLQDDMATIMRGEENRAVNRDDLVALAEYQQPIYAGLKETGRIERGEPDQPYQMVINGENYHTLELLLFPYAGKVDCIYIDPPYNTGAKDWKYNNDYVGGDDTYRHSKWLAFMERRLKLAKQLLNPRDSVLICAIDEKEYLRLGMLLEQVFPEARIQMVTCVISSQGSIRENMFSRADEYLFFVFLGNAAVSKGEDDMLNEGQSATKGQLWFQFVRTGKGNLRENSKNLFYPIFVDANVGRIISIGNPLPLGVPTDEVEVPEGLTAIWPITADGREARWRTGVDVARRRLSKGLLRLGRTNKKAIGWSVLTVNEGTEKRIEAGEVEITGHDSVGAAKLHERFNGQLRTPKTVWNKTAHNAGWHGSKLLASMLPGRAFPYPKSLYSVEDALRFVVADKPNALIVDFFAGSGTTLHATMHLNHADGGHRCCICVTNNEVGDKEETRLMERGVRQGDSEWEALGICEYITKPRIIAAITGKTPEGDPIKGSYKFNDEFPMADGLAENAVFYNLEYLDRNQVEYGMAFRQIAPLLWMRAGSKGGLIADVSDAGYQVADSYAVLFEWSKIAEFLEAVEKAGPGVGAVYVVTDDDRRYQSVCAEFPELDVVQLYESYLRTFKIAAEGALQ